jgi:hypothetical protein
MWKDGNVVSFKATVPARGVTVFSTAVLKCGDRDWALRSNHLRICVLVLE